MRATLYSRKLIEKIEYQLINDFMLKDKETVLCAVSGGCDSVCLLYILVALSKTHWYNIKALHVNHGIRDKEAKRDEDFVRSLCKSLNIEFFCERIDVPEKAKEIKKSEEETARIMRYECFEKTADRINADRIALAHHANDSVETFLFNLFRGTNIRGLMGIPRFRDRYIRPLLNVQRNELEAYAKENALLYVHDSTNDINTYTRNKIRNILIPFISENINDRAVYHVSRLSEDLSSLYELALPQITEIVNDIIIEIKYHYVRLDRKKARTYKKEYLCYCLNEILNKARLPLKDVSSVHYDDIYSLLSANTGRSIDLPNRLIARTSYDELIISHNEIIADCKSDNCVNIDVSLFKTDTTMSYNMDSITINITKLLAKDLSLSTLDNKQEDRCCIEYFDYMSLARGTIAYRKAVADDYMVIDKKGSKKKLNRLLIDAKVDKNKRESIFALAKDNELLWIPKLRRSSNSMIGEFTLFALKIEVLFN